MAMTSSQIAAAELERVDPKVPQLFERDDITFSMIEKRPAEVVSSREMRVPLEIQPHGDFGLYDPEGGDLGRGGGTTYDKAVVTVKHFKKAVEINRLTQMVSDSGRKAVVNALRESLSKAMADFRRQVNSQLHTDGTGVLATISTVATGSSVDTYTLNAAGDGFRARLLVPGQKINVYSANLGTKRTTLGSEPVLTLVDYDGKQVKCAEVSGAIATDKIVVAGTPTSGAPTSLQGIPYHHNSASTGLWLGMDRALIPAIRAHRTTVSGALNLPTARLAASKIGGRLGIKNNIKPIALMHPCQKAAYEELAQLISVIQKGAKNEAIDLFFGDQMQLAGSPVVIDWSADMTRIDFFVKEVWGRAEMMPPGFYKNNGGQRVFELRGASGGVAAADIFYIVYSVQTYVNNPGACSYMDGLSIPTGW